MHEEMRAHCNPIAGLPVKAVRARTIVLHFITVVENATTSSVNQHLRLMHELHKSLSNEQSENEMVRTRTKM